MSAEQRRRRRTAADIAKASIEDAGLDVPKPATTGSAGGFGASVLGTGDPYAPDPIPPPQPMNVMAPGAMQQVQVARCSRHGAVRVTDGYFTGPVSCPICQTPCMLTVTTA